MKKTLSIFALFALAAECFATGPLPINSYQSGFINFTNGGSATNVYTFPVGFTYPPAVSLFLVSANTNALPFTNTVTTTNFTTIINTTVNGATNATIAWTATPCSVFEQWSTTVNTAGVATNVAFPVPYVYPPMVNAQPNSTNGFVAITAITTTNFTLLSNIAMTNYWNAIGEVVTPGTQPATH
jgi:hypothetical protein